MKPEQPPPACMCMPSGWMSPQAMSAPSVPGGVSTPSVIGSTPAMARAPASCASLDDLGAVGLDRPEVAGALPVHGGVRVVELGLEVLEVGHAGLAVPLVEADLGAVGHRLRLAQRARLHEAHGAHVRRHEDLVAAGDAPGHAERAPGHVAPVVDGVGDAVEVQQLAEHAVELVAREVLAEVRVVAAAVGADELGPVDDLVHDRRHVVLPAAGAAEVQEVDGRGVLVEQPLHVLAQGALAEDRRRDVQRPLEAQALGDLRVDLLDAAQPQLVEHGLLGGRHRVGDVRVDERLVSHCAACAPSSVDVPRVCDHGVAAEEGSAP